MTGLLAGLIIGVFLRDIRDYVNKLYEAFRDRIERPAGVVKPIVTVGSQAQPDNSSTGAIRPPSPEEYAFKEFQERNRRGL